MPIPETVTDEIRRLRVQLREARSLLIETIHTYYTTDTDEPCWAEDGLGAEIAKFLGLMKRQ
jgi:hypothetical protein